MERRKIYLLIFYKVVIVLLFLSISVPSFAGYKINFKNTTLKDFIKFVSEFTGINIVYDEKDIRGQITIDSQIEMTPRDVLDIFYTVLRANNLVPIRKKNYIQIIRASKAKYYPDRYVEKLKGYREDIITTVISVKNLNLESVAKTIGKLRSRFGFVEYIRGVNVIVVRDLKSYIDKMLDVISKLEGIASTYKIHALQLKNVKASNVEKKIRKLYSEMRKKLMIGKEPVIISDDVANILIIAARDEDYKKIEELVSYMDVKEGYQGVPKVFYLKNAVAEDVEKILRKLLIPTVARRKGIQKLVSVASDKATNSIIILGDQEIYKRAEELIKKLDIPRQQVYVEALIIETTLEKVSSFGIEWLVGAGKKSIAGSVGYINRDGNLIGFQAPVLSGNPPNFAALPGGFTLGVLGNVITYEGVKYPTLSALANALRTASGINILSNPQILTLDNEEAEIFVGENRPFITSTKFDANNNPIQTYDYRDVGVKLRITPHISSDSSVTLQIYQEVKKVIASASPDVPAPITLTRSTKTKVKLKSGAIMVISGLIKDDSGVTTNAVPVLSKIPVFGWLFKSRSRSSEKTNMMVFISTHIIRTQKEANKLTEQKRKGAESFHKIIEENLRKEF